LLDTPPPLMLRSDLPLYPVHTQLCRVTAATVPGPMVGSPNLYVSYVEQVVSSSQAPRDRELCLVNDLTGGGLAPGFYICRLVTSYTYSGTTYPVYAAVGATQDVPVDDYCTLAGMQQSDCLLVVGPYGSVTLSYSGGVWTSTEEIEYPYGATVATGLLVFSFSAGSLHLTLGGMELLNCDDGCFTGGPLTGHEPQIGGPCAGETFTLCIVCVPCGGSGQTGGSGGSGSDCNMCITGSGGGTGGNYITDTCCGCPGGTLPQQWSLVVAGVTDDYCVGCSPMNGTFTLNYAGFCTWSSEVYPGPCVPQIGAYKYQLICYSPTSWVLQAFNANNPNPVSLACCSTASGSLVWNQDPPASTHYDCTGGTYTLTPINACGYSIRQMFHVVLNGYLGSSFYTDFGLNVSLVSGAALPTWQGTSASTTVTVVCSGDGKFTATVTSGAHSVSGLLDTIVCTPCCLLNGLLGSLSANIVVNVS
jgi:hypothetical protein